MEQDETIGESPKAASVREPLYDILVAGGGIAGLLAAARLAAANPERRIALIEREGTLGGRLRLASSDHDRHGYGLGAVSAPLYALWQQVLEALGNTEESTDRPVLGSVPPRRQATVAVLAGNRLVEQDIEQWFTAKGARLLGGMAAAKHWSEVEDLVRKGATAGTLEAEDVEEANGAEAEIKAEAPKARSHAVAHFWQQTRKAPAAIVLEHFAGAFGIPDVWDADPAALGQRSAFHSSRLLCGDWCQEVATLLAHPGFGAAVTVVTGNRIVDADQQAGSWVVTTEKGLYRAKSLVVAQPPWQATAWLKRTFWPSTLLQLASKTKPVSIVVLAEKASSPAAAASLPDVILVPAERVQIIREGHDEVCFQATIDFEASLQAPAVVKAVKALKRARKKLLQVHPGVVTEQSFIALLPVAWAQSPQHSDRRWLERLGRKPFNTQSLAFCGDAYGVSYDGDTNIIKSVFQVCAALGP